MHKLECLMKPWLIAPYLHIFESVCKQKYTDRAGYSNGPELCSLCPDPEKDLRCV